jgi:hypothetical protein
MALVVYQHRWLIPYGGAAPADAPTPYVDDLHRVLPNKEMVMRLRLIWPHLRCCERRRLRQVCRGFADLALRRDPQRCSQLPYYWRRVLEARPDLLFVSRGSLWDGYYPLVYQ